jgi:uncharacterized protein (TIGR00251 family)
MASWFRRLDSSATECGEFLLQVKAKPRAGKNAVLGVVNNGEALVVAITAPPVDGEANEAIIAVLAKAIGVKKSAIAISRGTESRHKQISIRGVSIEMLRALENGPS